MVWLSFFFVPNVVEDGCQVEFAYTKFSKAFVHHCLLLNKMSAKIEPGRWDRIFLEGLSALESMIVS
jgi:hypothetical protein